MYTRTHLDLHLYNDYKVCKVNHKDSIGLIYIR